MKIQSVEEIIKPLYQKKQFFREKFGVTKMGIFGSFAKGTQTESSDIDILFEVENDKKSLHNFLELKRLLEQEFNRNVDLGFEHTLHPVILEKIKNEIKYV